MSRPPKPIDWDLVDKLLEAGCLGTEIAANFDMHPNTFYERVTERYKMSFTQYSSEKKSKGDSILRAVQYQVAVKEKDKTMLIWLGKQRLGQREPKEKETFNGSLSVLLESIGKVKNSREFKDFITLLEDQKEEKDKSDDEVV